VTSFQTSDCRGCGKPIVWATTATSKIPLDPRAAVYVVDRAGMATRAPDGTFVTHFATCRDANKFTKSAETKASAQDEIDALREDLRKERDEVAKLREQVRRSKAPPSLFDRPAGDAS